MNSNKWRQMEIAKHVSQCHNIFQLVNIVLATCEY